MSPSTRWILVVVAATWGCAHVSERSATAPPLAPPASPSPAPGAAAEPPVPEPIAREYVPATARALLHDRMSRHAADAEGLRTATLQLDYEAIDFHAGQIATEPRVARPGPGGLGTLNASIPESFYVEQDALRAAAVLLRDAARQRDDARLTWAYGRVSRTCVSCHARFLRR
jgi:hypothetical protein